MTLHRRALLAAVLAPAVVRAQRDPLRITLAPYLSPGALLAAWRPLREQLQQRLARPVELLTARDFRALADATRRGEHEVAQLPAHLARMAMLDWRWQPLPSPHEQVTVIVAVKGDGPVRSAADLRGQPVGMLDPLSLTATIGRRWLQRQGLDAGSPVVTMASVNSALHALAAGEVAAVVAADSQLTALPPGTPRGERVLASVTDIPGPQFIARPDLGSGELAQLREAMGAFVHDPAKPVNAANAPLRMTEPARLAALDDLVGLARAALSR